MSGSSRGQNGRETVGEGLGALPTHGRENRARLRKRQRRPILHHMSAPADLRRLLPSVEQVLQRPEVRALEARHGRALVVRELRAPGRGRAGASGRGRPRGRGVGGRRSARALAARLDRARAASLVPVINATGVVVHTNLGRSRLPAGGGGAGGAHRHVVLEPRVRPRGGRARAARGARGDAPARPRRRGGGGGGQQQRGRRAPRRQHLRRGPRSAGQPRRAGRDRRLLPHPRRAAQGRSARCARSAPPTARASRTTATPWARTPASS